MKNKLKIMLKDLIESNIFEGKWFVADGALLGIKREEDLLEFDDDIDIYVLPNTKINWDKLNKKFNYYKDYSCYKIYDKQDKIISENEWLRYIAYKRTMPKYYRYNRAELTTAICDDYKTEKIIRNYPDSWIDIFVLEYDNHNNLYRIPQHWNGTEFYFTPLECEGTYDNTLGFNIKIPKNAEKVLERIYGSNWIVEDRDHQY
tara:strand:+ start:789 stop:1397 length:609 start_codon:yes stop_codon:yes gene_type:complete